ncbi:DUF3828 domain-containing protein [Terricaulis silvestris]|uniref:DUF3828 domain-containing protein n=1 Tax=Terricaulis silvestris TaxID=2686094 RepID=A0A6I6MQT7_9CAUL|nr:DUF3828 domain-containing protein [Terricaulis silvestris]QGZ93942.1 hypothetical protein DSM104635_00757 [Terricaulis silvestris]
MYRRNLIIGLGAAALGACSPPAGKQDEPATDSAGRAMTDPAMVIRQLYEPYLTPGATFPDFQNQAPWSAGLWTTLQAMMARSQTINEPILDFDPLIAAQDYQLANLNVVTESMVEASTAVVRASFTNANTPTEVVYDMIWENDRWKVDNIRGAGWDLRQIASAPNTDSIPAQ